MRKSQYYVTTLDPQSACDMEQLVTIKKSVKIANMFTKQQYRVCLRGRKPIVRGKYAYDRGGNVVGGIKNASKYDVYIYERY